MKEAAEERRRRNRARVGGGGARRPQGETRRRSCAVERRHADERSRSLLLRDYDHGEVAVRPKRRLCTTNGAREGSFGRFGEGHGGGGGERTRGPRGDAYRIVASRSSHVRATATSRDRRRKPNGDAPTLRALVRHSCSLSLSFFLSFLFFRSFILRSFSSLDIALLASYLIMLVVKYDDIGDRSFLVSPLCA